jgi:predicted AAA+ superfamily ATPase
LRGNLFENLIITVFLKQRYNQSKLSNLFFWRDHIGNEIDLLIEKTDTLIPIEIKSSQTLRNPMFEGLKKLKKFSCHYAEFGHLVYAGSRSTKLFQYSAHGWNDFLDDNRQDAF